MIDLAPIAELLENMGIKHAPEQRFLDSPGIDGRYVCLKDPPGVYYLLGTDNQEDRIRSGIDLTEEVMIIFLSRFISNSQDTENICVDPRKIDEYAAAISYKIKEVRPLPSDNGEVLSFILEPA